MNNQIVRRIIMLERVDQFGIKHPLTPAIPRATALYAEIKTYIGQLNTAGAAQDTGRAEMGGGVDERLIKADALRTVMRDIARIAKQLDPVLFPGLDRQLRLPKTSEFQALKDRAQTFVDVLETAETKAAFVERGFDEEFTTEFETMLEEFNTATSRKNSGLGEMVHNTEHLDEIARKGVKAMRELDTIIRPKLRPDPGLLAEWESAIRIPRKSAEEEDAPAPATPPSGGNSGTAP